jgi:hypothetical protein
MLKMNKPAAKPAKNEVKISDEKKAENKKYLERVTENVVFWCHDGQVFRDMLDLLNGMDNMSDETFAYHLNDVKNDFSCWIIEIIGDEQLGQDLKKVKTRGEAKDKIKMRYSDLTQLEG